MNASPTVDAPAPESAQAVEQRLEQYFDLLGSVLWDRRQRHSFATYATGLMSELERKSLEPIAASNTTDVREAERLHQRLQNFVADAPWPDAQVRRLAAQYALCAMQKHAPIQVWVCDDTAFPKQGKHSVGVQRQYCGTLGKVANCQVAPSLVVATEYTHLPIDMTLYLGQKWATDPALRKAAGIPDEVQFATKPELMLELLTRARLDGIPPGVVLGDSAFGDSQDFRTGVRDLCLHYILGVHLSTKVCLLSNPKESAPQRLQSLLLQLPESEFRRYTWRDGAKGRLSARFAFRRVRIPKDPRNESLWLILEWRDDEAEPRRAHLSSLPPSTARRRLVYLLKERYRTEQTYREMKQELGLDHYEGRKYRGFEHHVTVVLSSYAFLVAQREGAFPPEGPQSHGSPRAQRLEPTPSGAYAGATAAPRGAFRADDETADRAGRSALAGQLPVRPAETALPACGALRGGVSVRSA